MRRIKVLCLITAISFFSFFNISSAKSEILQVSDVLLDIQTLKGKNVVVKGFFVNVATLAFIYEESFYREILSQKTKETYS